MASNTLIKMLCLTSLVSCTESLTQNVEEGAKLSVNVQSDEIADETIVANTDPPYHDINDRYVPCAISEKRCYIKERATYICIDAFSICPEGPCIAAESYCRGPDGELKCTIDNRHCLSEHAVSTASPSPADYRGICGTTRKYCEGKGCVSLLQDCRCDTLFDEYCAAYNRCVDIMDYCPGKYCNQFECADRSDCIHYSLHCDGGCDCGDCSDEADCISQEEKSSKISSTSFLMVAGVFFILLAVCVSIYSKAKGRENLEETASIQAPARTRQNNIRYTAVEINRALNNSTAATNTARSRDVEHPSAPPTPQEALPAYADQPPAYQDIVMNTPPIQSQPPPGNTSPYKESSPPPPSYDAAVNL